jgi:hypothetical protein
LTVLLFLSFPQIRENFPEENQEKSLEFKHVPLGIQLLASLTYFGNKDDAFNLTKYIQEKQQLLK